MDRVFLLSPASCRGRRAGFLLDPKSDFAMARALRSAEGARLGDVFAFLSGLYFRGKLTYARAFARTPRGAEGVLVITADEGLVSWETSVDVSTLRRWAERTIDLDETRYAGPLVRDARALDAASPGVEVVLLGSIATEKYVAPLASVFGERLLFPSAFVGRGDMSRGGLLLRAAASGVELEVAPVAGAVRRGARPPRLSSGEWLSKRPSTSSTSRPRPRSSGPR